MLFRIKENENPRKSVCSYWWCIWFRAATATYLVGQGAKVIMVDMNQDLGESLQHRLGEHAEFVMLDVTSEAQQKLFFNMLRINMAN